MLENPFVFKNGWEIEDFLYGNNSICGFSRQGKEKVKTKKFLSIPAFYYGNKEKTLIEDIMVIEQYAFQGYGLKSVEIPRTILKIGEGAFEDNEIEYTIFHGHLNNLRKLAFKNNPEMKLFLANPRTNLEDLEKVKELFTNVKILDLGQLEMIVFFPDSLFCGMGLKEIILPPNLMEIGKYALGNNKFKKIHFPNTLKTIGICSFMNNELQSVEIPDSVEKIMSEAFTNNKITKIVFSKNQKDISFRSFKKNMIEELDIPDNIEFIDDEAFFCNPIKKLKLGNDIKKIGQGAFPETKEVEEALFRYALKNKEV